MRITSKNISKTRMRKSTKIIVTILSLLLLAFALIVLVMNFLISSDINNKKEIYSYTNKFKYDYTVNLIENDFTDDTVLKMSDNAYVTELIDNIELNLDYSYIADKSSNVDLKYNVTAKLVGNYVLDGKEQNVWNKEYVLLPEKDINLDVNRIDVDEKIILDLKSNNKLVKDFEQKLNMNIYAKYLVFFNVTATTVVEEQNITNKYSNSISFDLGSKTTSVEGKNNIDEKQFVTKDEKVKKNINPIQIICAVISLIVSLILFRKVSKAETTRLIRNQYRLELNKILRLCEDKIVEVSNKIEIDEKNVVDVKDFGEIIKLSEELFKPILYWSSTEKQEAWFCVLSNNVSYRYILKK